MENYAAREFPEVRLWIFNNPVRGITEQLEFLALVLGQQGYRVRISNQPSAQALNILIENLNEKTYPVVEKFCTEHALRIAVVMTEHIDYVGRKIYFHGLPFSEPSEYMHALTRRARLLHLLIARNFIRCFLRLGDLPALRGLDEMFPGIPVVGLPFPQLPVSDRTLMNQPQQDIDLVFSGLVTSYRKKILSELEQHFRVVVIDRQISRRRRDAANSSAKAVLNIPQDPAWSWVSSMRIMAAWRCGRPVINMGVGLHGVLAEYCLNVPATEAGYELIKHGLSTPAALFQQQKNSYNGYVASSKNGSFPEIQFRIWSMTQMAAIKL